MADATSAHATGELTRASSMVSRILLALLLLPCIASALSLRTQNTEPALKVTGDRPALVFESYLADSSHLTAESKPVISEEFYFRNQGQSVVHITELKPSCGCLSPTISSREIPPGETGRITLPIRTANEPAGLREYLLTVQYEDPKPREVTLTWKLRLPEKKLLIEPRVLMVIGESSPTTEYSVTISDFRQGKAQKPLQILDITAAPEFIQAKLASQSAGDELSQTRLDVRFTADVPPGQHRGLITVMTDDADYPAIQIPVVTGRPEKSEQKSTHVTPEMGRVVVQRNQVLSSVGTDIRVNVPAAWTLERTTAWPPQLVATTTKTPSAGDEIQAEFVTEIGLSELPAEGIFQGLILLHFRAGDQPRLVSVPLSIVWL